MRKIFFASIASAVLFLAGCASTMDTSAVEDATNTASDAASTASKVNTAVENIE
ncbi:hypothetical protein [Vibrio marisflavi]|uniref:Lipoprotein n=1 Tax=Vibrio marisflavi CECT 7928 TaxID=634439 RepID=A0ABM9A107_9VIBR|nr:hypothetical protein [Vibrio marisflavi]CAH0537313.1 hypothetical protein VMF7928_01047 [Vibrio marisflavi CECT 7928]